MKIMNNINVKNLGIAALLAGMATALGAVDASAHGYVSMPKSRVVMCKENDLENPTLPACIAAKEAGNRGFYDLHNIAIYGAKDNHQELIPDGKLCSAGLNSYVGLDLTRNDWPSTRVHPGPQEFVWTHTAASPAKYFRYYITKVGFNPAGERLKWSDLELIHDSGPALEASTSKHLVNLPQRTGRHIIYSIWQRDWADAPEAHYQCIDVEFDSQPGSSSSSAPSSSSSPSSISSSSSSSSPSNNPPLVALTAYVNYYSCGSVNGVASAHGSIDPDGDALDYAWEITGEYGYIARYTGETVSFGMRPVTNYIVKLTVTDGKGGTTTASKSLYHSYSDDCTRPSSSSSSWSVRSSSSSNPSSLSSSSRSSSSAPAKANCSYVVNSQWSNGFTAAIRIKNTSTQTINGWSVNWQYADASKVTGLWNADLSGTNPYTAKNQGWNANIQPGQTVELGFQGNKPTGAAIVPVVSGDVCQ